MERQRIAVVYDERCHFCQALVRRLRRLDRHQRLAYMPAEIEILPQVHPALTLEACQREMHVVTPEGQILAGWDGVVYLARLFPLTWLIGVLGDIVPFRWLGRRLYRFVARHRSGLVNPKGYFRWG